MKRVSVNYDEIREDLLSVKDALNFIVKADESDAGGSYRFSGLAYAKVAQAGLVHCDQVIKELEKATTEEVSHE